MEWIDISDSNTITMLVLTLCVSILQSIVIGLKKGKYRRIVQALILGIEEAGHKETKAQVADAAWAKNVGRALDAEIELTTKRAVRRQRV